MKTIGINDYQAEPGDEVTFTEDTVIAYLRPYDPTHISVRVFNSEEEMREWVEKDFTNLDYEIKQGDFEFIFEVVELNT